MRSPTFQREILCYSRLKVPWNEKWLVCPWVVFRIIKIIVAYFYVKIPFSSHKVSCFFVLFFPPLLNGLSHRQDKYKTPFTSMWPVIMGWSSQPLHSHLHSKNAWRNIPSAHTSNHREIIQSNRHFMGPLHTVDACWDMLAHYYSNNTLGRPRKLSHRVVNANKKNP